MKGLRVLPKQTEEPIFDDPGYNSQARSAIQVQLQRVMSIAEVSRQLQTKSKEADKNVVEQDDSFKRFMNENSKKAQSTVC